MEELIAQMENEIRAVFFRESSGHDVYHLKRVMNTALAIQKQEGGDKIIIAISALLHDIHRIIQNETGKFCSPKQSLTKVSKILDKTNITDNQKKKVLNCIEYHEEYNFSKSLDDNYDIETMILQDADRLDAIGALGIGRTFSFGGKHNIGMWIPEIPFDKDNYDSSKTDPSIIHHFYSKLLNLKEGMNTNTAKKMANERHKFMESFLKQFFDEWNGKK